MRHRAGENSSFEGAAIPAGTALVETETRQEMDAFDSLPARVRMAMAEAPFSFSADQTLTAYLRGIGQGAILDRIEDVSLALVEANPSVPGEDYRGRAFNLRPRPGSRPRRTR